MSPSLGVLAFLAALGLLSACAARPAAEASAPAQPAGAPAAPADGAVQSSEPAAEPGADDLGVMSLDQAAATFEQAERRIGELLALGEAPPPAPNGADEAQVETESPGKTAARRLSEYADGPDRCLSACQALASMQRSATRLCELTGEDDPRCGDVRGRVEQARQLVSDACPSCIVAQPTDE